MARDVIVVDTESNGLDREQHIAVEVAWINLNTNESGCFIPAHDANAVLELAEPRALEINGYRERIYGRPQDLTGHESYRLAKQLEGNTLAGATPDFDAAMLAKVYWGTRMWHHRLFDLDSYAMGVLGLSEPPGLNKLCRILDLGMYPDHSAEGDRDVTVQCFAALAAIRGRLTLAVA